MWTAVPAGSGQDGIGILGSIATPSFRAEGSSTARLAGDSIHRLPFTVLHFTTAVIGAARTGSASTTIRTGMASSGAPVSVGRSADSTPEAAFLAVEQLLMVGLSPVAESARAARPEALPCSKHKSLGPLRRRCNPSCKLRCGCPTFRGLKRGVFCRVPHLVFKGGFS